MIKKEMIDMLLAGGQGSRLGVLTANVAKPAVSFGGKYRIIDFPLSNCINSGVDTVGVLTQYQPLKLNTHIGIGIPWDLDRNIGGVTVLPPYEKIKSTEWYTGTANAILQNIDYMDSYNPEYVPDDPENDDRHIKLHAVGKPFHFNAAFIFRLKPHFKKKEHEQGQRYADNPHNIAACQAVHSYEVSDKLTQQSRYKKSSQHEYECDQNRYFFCDEMCSFLCCHNKTAPS